MRWYNSQQVLPPDYRVTGYLPAGHTVKDACGIFLSTSMFCAFPSRLQLCWFFCEHACASTRPPVVFANVAPQLKVVVFERLGKWLYYPQSIGRSGIDLVH